MSTGVNHYVMIGRKYDYDDFYNRIAQHNGFATAHSGATRKIVDHYADASFGGISQQGGICIIPDTMNKEYVYVGFVVYKSKDDGDLDDFVSEIVPSPTAVKHNIAKAIGFETETELLAFTHRR